MRVALETDVVFPGIVSQLTYKWSSNNFALDDASLLSDTTSPFLVVAPNALEPGTMNMIFDTSEVS